MLGLTLLLTKRSQTTTLLAGLCLGVACWIKYPALLFLPVYIVAAPRRMPVCFLGWLGTSVLLCAPYLGVAHLAYDQSVTWQLLHRHHADPTARLQRTILFWLIANPLAVITLLRVRKPTWLLVGFGSGAMYFFVSSTYSHYFVPIAPFAALLAAAGIVQLVRVPSRPMIAGALALTVTWTANTRASVPGHGLEPGYRLSALGPTIRLLQRSAPRGAPILADHFEYAYLTGHPWVAHYFWNAASLVDARYLERRLTRTSVVISRPLPGEDTYPAGFPAYLRAHYVDVWISGTTIWLSIPHTRAHRPPDFGRGSHVM
jgi:hypothetical protein